MCNFVGSDVVCLDCLLLRMFFEIWFLVGHYLYIKCISAWTLVLFFLPLLREMFFFKNVVNLPK